MQSETLEKLQADFEVMKSRAEKAEAAVDLLHREMIRAIDQHVAAWNELHAEVLRLRAERDAAINASGER